MIEKLTHNRYLTTFVITITVFVIAGIVSNFLNNRRINEIRDIQEGIATDILSLETQFDLFESHLTCEDLTSHTVLSNSLRELATRLTNAESTLGIDDEEVLALKRTYTLLQIKDLVLMTKIKNRCGGGPTFILYFYSNESGECPDCIRQGYVLSELGRQFPEELRIYAFDYHLSLGVLETLITLNKLEPKFPALIIGSTVRYEYQNIEDIEAILPHLATIRENREAEVALETATTTE